MSVRLPLSVPQASERTGALRLPITGLLSGASLPLSTDVSGRQGQVLRAVAAAGAMCNPKEAIAIAAAAKAHPETVVDPTFSEQDADRLAKVLEAVNRRIDDRREAPEPSDEERAAAAAAGADAILVATARSQLGTPESCEAARRWVAAVRPELLDAAARAGARARQLRRIPTDQQLDRVTRLEAAVASLERQVAMLPAGDHKKRT